MITIFLQQLQSGDYIQLVIGIFTFAAILISIFIYRAQRSTDRKREAVKVGLSVEQLVVRWAYIDMVIHRLDEDVYKLMADADASKMLRFESDEIREVFSNKEITRIKTLFLDNYFNPRLKSSPSIVFKVTDEIINDANDLYPLVFNDVLGGKLIIDSIHSFHRVVIDTLNRMETLCVMIDKKIADENTVFDTSGYQFIQFVKILYYYISFINNSDKIAKEGPHCKSMKYVTKIFRRWVRKMERKKL